MRPVSAAAGSSFRPRDPFGGPPMTLRHLMAHRSGLMREMTERLGDDPDLAAAYRRAHESYLAERDAIEPLGTDVSAGGKERS